MADLTVPKGGIRKALGQLVAMKNRFAVNREKAEEKVSATFLLVEVGAADFGWGYANAKYGKSGPVKIMGFDGDLLVGIALTGMGLFDAAGKHSEHLLNLGAGSVGSFLNRKGSSVAANSAAKTGYAPAGSFHAGYAPAGDYRTGFAPAGAYR